MAKALGIGGIFFKTEDPAGLAAWYRKWLSFPGSDGDYVPFPPSGIPEGGFTLWSPFAKDSEYFGIPDQTFMINIMVDDLDEALKQVVEGGAQAEEKTEDYPYGRFGWFIDPAGNRSNSGRHPLLTNKMRRTIQNHLQRLSLSLVLGFTLLGFACSKKPTSVTELFPEVAYDERAQAKQFAIKATGSNPMIDDLEDGDLNGIKADGRNWSWAQFDDMTDGIQYLTIDQEKEGSRQGSVLYVKGGGWQKTGAGVSANLVYKTTPRKYGYYDASVFSGIEFWIKAKGLKQLTVSIGTPKTTSIDDGGIRLNSPTGHFVHLVSASGEWAQVRIPFSDFRLSNGKQTLASDPSRIKGIHFGFNTTTDYEAWIDDISFFKETGKD